MEREGKENILRGTCTTPQISHKLPPFIAPGHSAVSVLREDNYNGSESVSILTCGEACGGNEPDITRMNTTNDGFNNKRSSTYGKLRSRASPPSLTGQSNAEAGPGQSSSSRLPQQGMLSGHPKTTLNETSAHNPTMLASATATPGGGLTSILRPPPTPGDSGRHNSISALYCPSPLSPYTLPNSHVAVGQGGQLSAQYGTYFPGQLSSGYPQQHRTLLSQAQHYPQIDSYSAVLQRMGTQVQQSQLPRSPNYPASLPPQYTNQRSLSVSTPQAPISGPGGSPAGHSQLPSSGPLADPEVKASILRDRDTDGLVFPYKGDSERSQSLSSIEVNPVVKTVSFKDPPPRLLRENPGREGDIYKIPNGKEGSLKHRILTRPSDSDSSNIDAMTTNYKSRIRDQPSPKRVKVSSGENVYSDSPSHGAPVRDTSDRLQEPRSPPPQEENVSNMQYPPYFAKGSIIELANGELKRVEDLQTADFVQSAEISNDLKIDSSLVSKIDEDIEKGTVHLGFVVGEHKVQVTVEANAAHPFFVFGQGWSSFNPKRTFERYGLTCQPLAVGDVCISLTHREVSERAAELRQKQREAQEMAVKDETAVSSSFSSSSSSSSLPSSPKTANRRSSGDNCHSVSSDSVMTKTERSPKNSESNSNTDQHPVETRPPRKRPWSSSTDTPMHENQDHH